MSMTKKFNKKKRELHAGKLLALQNTIRLTAQKSVEFWVMLNLGRIKTEIPDIQFDGLSYVSLKMAEGIKDHEELFEKLCGVYYTDGEESPIEMDQEKYNDFMVAIKDYVTVDRIVDTYSTYDSKEFKMEKILEGARIVNGVAAGEEFEVVTQ